MIKVALDIDDTLCHSCPAFKPAYTHESYKSTDRQSAGSGGGGSLGTGLGTGLGQGFRGYYSNWKGFPVRMNNTYDFNILGTAVDRITGRFGGVYVEN